jgi:arabinofuranan 3-O-arabinosyltransferase
VCLLLAVTAFHQSPGYIGNDTKLDLTADPGRFLRRSLDLWDPSAAFGRLQNQAYGYLFPMGPFHALGKAVGMPEWVIQRAWMGLLLSVAFLGVVKLADRMALGTANTRLLGALAYALSPRVITLLGGNSAELWPIAVLPWVLLPLAGDGARERPRRAAMRSGVAVLCMGAANATTVLALLPLPALFLLPGIRHAAGRRLAAWWAVAVTLACAWWFVPLVLQGKYSSDFLNYIETARTTTSFTGPAEALSGTSHWLGYLAAADGQPWWRAGWLLVTNSWVIVDLGLLAALGLVGLLRRGMPRQGRLGLAAGLGLLVLAAPHVGPLDGPLAQQLQDLLDGGLAAFRNLHKFDGLVRLPLALGLVHLVAQVDEVRARRLLGGIVAIALVGAASPAIAGQLVPRGSYDQIPSWWVDAGHFLDDHNASGHALVLPASGFAEYYWGRPLDNPLQALTSTSWAVRDAVPLGSAGSTRLLDAIEQRLDSGHGSPALSAVLARMGVSYLVISGDLSAIGTPRRVLVQQALDESPGIALAQTFGPARGGDPFRPYVTDSGLEVSLPTLQVYAVDGGGAPVTTLPTAGTWQVSGGPESLFALAERGLLAHRATVLAGDPAAGETPQTVLTDGLRRREINFGSVRDNSSQTLTADATPTVDRRAIDVLPQVGDQHLATARLIGATSVTASSSAADVGSLFHTGAENQPYAAFDGDAATQWVSGALVGTSGQWVELALGEPVDPTGTTIRLGGPATVVTVRTDTGQERTQLEAGDEAQPLRVPEGSTRHLRVTVAGASTIALAAIREISVPGVSVRTTIALAQDQQQTDRPVVLLDRAAGARSGCVTTGERAICARALGRAGEDEARLDRTFSLDQSGPMPVVGTALPVSGPALDSWLDRGLEVHATASSRLVPDPSVRPSQVLDGRLGTAWIAAPDDASPALTLTWKGARRVDGLTLLTDRDTVAARPTRVAVALPGRTVELEVPPNGVLRFPATLTDRIELRFVGVEQRVSVDPDGVQRSLPVGIGEVAVPALDGLKVAVPASTSQVALRCGQGPDVVLDGVTHPTAVLGSRRDLELVRPILLSACDSASLRLPAGEHRLVGGTRGALRVESLQLGQATVSTADALRPVEVRTWDGEHRVVTVGAGAESYLVVHENLNKGWQAELAGTRLQAVRIDGWQQAWVVPAGAGGQVTMSFAPGRTFHLALALGGLLALLLLVLALLPSRAREVGTVRELPLPAPLRVLVGLGVVGLVGGVLGAAAYLSLVVVGLLVRRTRVVWGGLAGLAVLASAVITAFAPWNGPRSPAVFGGAAQACAMIAAAAAAAALSVPRSPSAASGSEPAAPPVEG